MWGNEPVTATGFSNEPLAFPPVFTPVAAGGGDAFVRALAEAKAGSGAGTLVWSQSLERFDCAVVFEPDRSLERSLPALYVAALAIADALTANGPPNKLVTFAWPQLILVDGAAVGATRMAWPEGVADDAVPEWLVVGASLRMRWPAGLDDPGRMPGETALHEEGFGEVEAPALIESFSRHLLNRTSRWIEDGFDPIAYDWLGHLPAAVRNGPVRHGLDPNGDLLLLDPGSARPQRMALRPALNPAAGPR